MKRFFAASLGAAFAGLLASAPAQARETPFLGEVIPFAGTFCPRDTLEADGRLLQIDQNQSLFSLYGKAYGGDALKTFALPDLRGNLKAGNGSGEAAKIKQCVVINGAYPPRPSGRPRPSLARYSSRGGLISEVYSFGGTFCPEGSVPADGSLMPIAVFQAFFSLLGTNYGGDARTSFGLPNLPGHTSATGDEASVRQCVVYGGTFPRRP